MPALNSGWQRLGRRFAPDPASGTSAPSAACWRTTPPARARSSTATRAIMSFPCGRSSTTATRFRFRGSCRCAMRPMQRSHLHDIATALGGPARPESRIDRASNPTTPFDRLRLSLDRRAAKVSRSICLACWSARKGRWRCSRKRRCGRAVAGGARWSCSSASPVWSGPSRRPSACCRPALGMRSARSPSAQPGASGCENGPWQAADLRRCGGGAADRV